MIGQENMMLVLGLLLVSNIITYVLSSIYYAQRVYDLQSEHVEDMQEVNQELINARIVNRDNEMQARVMGAVPVSRLIKEEA